MGLLHKRVKDIVTQVDEDEVFVEIGTANGGDGSTHFLDSVARNLGTVLYSVDIDDRTEILQYLPGVQGVQMSGSVWAREIFPTLKKRIAFLYLDNFDWDWQVSSFDEIIKNQIIEYSKKYNLKLTNTNSQIEHLSQMLHLLPYMSDRSIIICDDTFRCNEVWSGKCGPVVVYLLALGWKILEIEDQPGAYGVMLGKNS